MRCWTPILLAALAFGLAASLAHATEPRVRLHLVGDSTLSDKLPEKRPETGWGEPFATLFEPGAMVVVNHARNGRSTRSFLAEGRWQAVLDAADAGDYVVLQFGHNDASAHKLDRYTPLPQYRDNLARFVREARAARLHPLLLTPVARRRFSDTGALESTHGDYPRVVRELASELEVPLIDAESLSSDLLSNAGPERSRLCFLHLARGEHPNYPQGLQDDTHFSPSGAAAIAERMALELRRQSHPLAAWLRTPSR